MAAKTTEDEGSLYDLQRLQEKADRRNAEFEVAKQEKAELADLQTKGCVVEFVNGKCLTEALLRCCYSDIKQLRERRDKLRERLKNGPHETVQEYLRKEKGHSSRKNFTDTHKQSILTAVRLLHKRKLADLCDAYRLTGISVASQEAKRTCFRCETFFNSKYHEPYYVEVELKDDNLKIHKHSVPYFIPIDTISKLYLNTDIKKFFMVISEHLSAFVARREQVQLCQERHREHLEGEISCSPAHDFLQFKPKVLEGFDKSIVVKLTYDRLTQTLPSGVELLSDGKNTSASMRTLHSKKKHFKKLFLHLAFAEAFT